MNGYESDAKGFFLMKKASILIVDDIWEFRDILETMLLDFGYDCHTAKSAKDAIELLSKETYTLVVLDMRLFEDECEVSGLVVIDWLRSARIDTKVIILTGYSNVSLSIMRDLFRSGVVVDYLEKDGDCVEQLFVSISKVL